MLSLTVSHDGRVRRFGLLEGRLRLGAAADNEVVLESEYVSAHHAEVTLRGDEIEIRDVGSLNGVYVDGRRIRAERRAPPVTFALGDGIVASVHELDTDELTVADGVGSTCTTSDPATVQPSAERSTEPGERHRPPTELSAALLRALSQSRVDARSSLGAMLRVVRDLLGVERSAVLARRHGPRRDLEVVQWLGIDQALDDGLADELVARVDACQPPEDLHFVHSRGSEHVHVVTRRMPDGDYLLALWGSQPGDASLASLGDALSLALATEQSRVVAIPGPRRETTRFELQVEGLSLPVSQAPPVVALHEAVTAATTSELPVLLRGETGTGKELYARAIHEQSARRHGPFRAVNSSAVPEQLLEALLFGTTKGVATGVVERAGLFRDADGGTLFLDEIGELSLPLQAKLLRAIDLCEVLAVGSTRPVEVDVRIISATNRDVAARVATGEFRRDLYYRLRGHEFELIPLRSRRSDLATLVDHFVRQECASADRRVSGMSVKAMNALLAHAWPGNIRELEMLIRQLVHVVPDGDLIRHEHLPSEHRARRDPNRPIRPLEESLDEHQRGLIRSALEECDGNRTTAARLLGISRGRLRRLVRRLGIAPE